ncbi:IPExxxVDY family protein [Polaribacter sp.]|uniref:IPExxxVDY family protein n=1 Tax=Polaribacter sp. TaxID=1920175 RepID=UPI003EF843AC
MQVHALVLDDFCDEEYSLIGIHTTLEEYKLAYLLNKNLGTHFSKSKEDLDLAFENEKKKASFSIYHFSSEKYVFDWFLIANSFRQETKTVSNELLLTTETKTYLIPEKKKVDFFIKISGEVDYMFVVKTIENINKIEGVITSYQIDKNTLKSKDFLIF